MKTLFVWIIILSSVMLLKSEEYFGSIKGRVINKETKQAMELITVKILNTKMGAISKSDGTFTIDNVPEGVYHIEFTMISYSKVIENSIRVIRNKTTTIKEIEMQENPFQTEAVVVHGSEMKSTEAKALTYSYSKSEIMRTPGSAGEVLRAIEVLPGVSSGGGEYASFMVRGASPIENIILIDGFPFSKITHFTDGGGDELASGGRFSIFSPLVIENAEFQGGGFSSKYGGKNASILDLKIKEGNSEDFTINATYDFLGYEFIYDGPSYLSKTTSVLFSGKHHNYKNIMKLIGAEQHGVPQLSDFTLKSTTNLGNHKFSILAIYSDENMIKTIDNLYSTNKKEDLFNNDIHKGAEFKNLYGLNWRWLTSDNSFLNTKVYYENIRMDANSGYAYTNPTNGIFPEKNTVEVDNHIYLHKQNQQKFGSKLDFTYIFSKGNALSFGGEVNYSKYDQSQILNKLDTIYQFYSNNDRPNNQNYIVIEPINESFKFKKSLSDYSLWSEMNLQLTNNLSITPGLRFELSQINNIPYLSPRLAFKYGVDETSSLNFATGIYYQVPLMKFIFTNDKIEQEKAYHFILGYNKYLSEDITFSAECYYKYLDNLVIQADNFKFGAVNQGYGYATGIDLSLVKKMTANFFGQISYSYSISKRNDDNGKGYYNSDYSQPHIFNILAAWQISDEWSISARWKFASGLPTDSYIVHNDVLDNPNMLRYSREITSKNTSRFNNNHSLNLRVDYRKQLFNRFAIVTFIDIMNVYGYQNQNETEFQPETGKVTNQGFSIMPTFGLKFEF